MNSADLSGLWVYLAATPLLGLTLTLLAYLIAWHIHQRLSAHPLANPVMIAQTTGRFTGNHYYGGDAPRLGSRDVGQFQHADDWSMTAFEGVGPRP